MLPGPVFVVTLQRVTQAIPDGIIRCHLRQLLQFIHDGIYHILERLFEIGVLLFAADCAQLQRKLQQLSLDRCGRFGDGFHAVNQIVHDCPRRFGHVFIRGILANIEIF